MTAVDCLQFGSSTNNVGAVRLAYEGGQMDGNINNPKSAFLILYERYKDPLRKFIYRSCLDSSITDDVTQEAWLSIYKQAASYKVKSTFKAYLFTVARNKLVDYWRGVKKLEPYGEYDPNSHPNDPEAQKHCNCKEQQQLLQILDTALRQLPEEQRSTLWLHYVDGFRLDEIAKITRVKRETVRSRLRYAKKDLRKIEQLREFLGDCDE